MTERCNFCGIELPTTPTIHICDQMRDAINSNIGAHHNYRRPSEEPPPELHDYYASDSSRFYAWKPATLSSATGNQNSGYTIKDGKLYCAFDNSPYGWQSSERRWSCLSCGEQCAQGEDHCDSCQTKVNKCYE